MHETVESTQGVPTIAATGPGEALLRLWLEGRSARTLETYRDDLRALAKHTGWSGPLEDWVGGLVGLGRCTVYVMALEWRGAMITQGLAPASINRRLSALRSLLSLARLTGHIDYELEVPNVRCQAYRDTRGPGRVVVASLKAALANKGDFGAVRALAAVSLMFDLGLRRHEVMGLRLEDLEREGNGAVLQVLRKGQRERVVRTLPVATLAALDAWLEFRGDAPGPLFVAKGGTPVHPTAMNKYLEDFCRKHGLPHVWCHGLRHTAITTLADMGHGLTDIASFGGWAKASTAGIYLDRSADRAGRMAEALAGCQQEDRITS